MGWVNIKSWRYNSRIKEIREEAPESLNNATDYLSEFRKYVRYLRRHSPKELEKIKQGPEYINLIDLVNKIESDK